MSAEGISTRCSGCAVAYHTACFEELGGCATLGCGVAQEQRTAQRATRAGPSGARRAAGGVALCVAVLVLGSIVGEALFPWADDPIAGGLLIVSALTLIALAIGSYVSQFLTLD